MALKAFFCLVWAVAACTPSSGTVGVPETSAPQEPVSEVEPECEIGLLDCALDRIEIENPRLLADLDEALVEGYLVPRWSRPALVQWPDTNSYIGIRFSQGSGIHYDDLRPCMAKRVLVQGRPEKGPRSGRGVQRTPDDENVVIDVVDSDAVGLYTSCPRKRRNAKKKKAEDE
jgi:hypothetical protein